MHSSFAIVLIRDVSLFLIVELNIYRGSVLLFSTATLLNCHVHQLAAPTFITIREPKKADAVDETLSKLDFVYDGITITSPQFLECIENSDEYRFPHYRSGRVKAIPAPQFVHRSGAIFIRKLTDREGKAILVGIENYRHASEENKFREIAKSVIRSVLDSIKTRPLQKVVEEKEETEKDQQ